MAGLAVPQSGVATVTPTSPVFPREPLTPAEVRELWAFLHGDIMVGGIRQLLRASLGLCPRHAWGYAVVEVELWIDGAGSRGGHQPFDVCVLYTDLLEQVVSRLRARRSGGRGSLVARLARQGPCRVCAALGPDLDGGPVTFAGSNSAELTAEANALRFTRQWLIETRPVWERRRCPACVDQPDPTSDAGDPRVWCLRHLTRPGAPAQVSATGLADYLAGLSVRLDALGRSMRQGAPAPSPAENASWVEALGWFAGWEFPCWLTSPEPGS